MFRIIKKDIHCGITFYFQEGNRRLVRFQSKAYESTTVVEIFTDTTYYRSTFVYKKSLCLFTHFYHNCDAVYY